MGVAAGERLHLDVMPADVLAPDGRLWRGVRVLVTSERLLAFAATPARTINLAINARLTESPPRPDRGTLRQRLSLETDNGTYHVNRAGGCGCGSPLKALGLPVGW